MRIFALGGGVSAGSLWWWGEGGEVPRVGSPVEEGWGAMIGV